LDLSTIRTDITDRVGPGTGLSSTTLTRWINEGQELFCASFGFPWLEKSDTDTTVASTQSYSIPSDCRKLLAVFVGDNEYTYVPFSLKENVDTDSSYDARAYYTFDNKIYLLPTPTTSGTTITFYYYKMPTTLSNDSDTPTIPTRYQEALVFYGLAMARDRDENMTAAREAMKKFDDILQLAIKQGADRKKGARRRMVSIKEFTSYKWPNFTYNKDWDN